MLLQLSGISFLVALAILVFMVAPAIIPAQANRYRAPRSTTAENRAYAILGALVVLPLAVSTHSLYAHATLWAMSL